MSEYDLRSFKRRINPYYDTLAHPTRVLGVRIPDENSQSTCTFTLVARYALTVNSNGVAAILIGKAGSARSGMVPFGEEVGTGKAPTTKFVVGFTNHAAASTAALFSDTVTTGSAPIQFPNWTQADDPIPSLFQSARLVSAGFSCFSSAAPLDLSGMYVAASLPRTLMTNYALSSITLDMVQSLPGALQYPLNDGKGVSMTYSPVDGDCLVFTGIDGHGTITEDTMSDPGQFIMAVSGATANSVIYCTYVGNYEAIPRATTLSFFNSDSAPDDPIAVAEAFNMRAEDKLVFNSTGDYNGIQASEGSQPHAMMKAFPSLGAHPEGGHHVLACPKRLNGKKLREVQDIEQKSTLDSILELVLPAAKALGSFLL